MLKTKNQINEATLTAFTVIMIFSVLDFPKTVAYGISNGLSLCGEIIIPSMFAFLFVADFTITSGFCNSFEKIGFISKFLFRLPASTLPTVILSLTGGFPIGAKMTAQLFENGYITENQAKRMLMFCINSGPAFVINTIGFALLGNIKAGLLIYTATTLSSIIIGIITRFFADCSQTVKIKPKSKALPTSEAFVLSVSNASVNMLNICSFILLFSVFSALLDLIKMPDTLSTLIKATTEITTASVCIKEKATPEIFALMLGWGGICVHFQILGYIKKCKMELWLFLIGRIANAVLSSVICMLLFKFIPISLEASTIIYPRVSFSSVPATAGLIIMAGLLVFEVAKKDSI
ncbi:MAG: hypothetical protein K5917_02165 [Clostridiales bacterium]|nr:hypothetical protein [Clostridiales bacterium]